MAPVTAEEVVQFLVSCIRNQKDNKIDFEGVARDCNIVSKGAAAKRYERILKSNNIHPCGGSLTSTPSNTPEKDAIAATSTTSTPTKRAGGVKRKAASPKKAKPRKKAVMKCEEDLLDKQNDNSDKGDENDDDDDGSLFKGVTIEQGEMPAGTYA